MGTPIISHIWPIRDVELEEHEAQVQEGVVAKGAHREHRQVPGQYHKCYMMMMTTISCLLGRDVQLILVMIGTPMLQILRRFQLMMMMTMMISCPQGRNVTSDHQRIQWTMTLQMMNRTCISLMSLRT